MFILKAETNNWKGKIRPKSVKTSAVSMAVSIEVSPAKVIKIPWSRSSAACLLELVKQPTLSWNLKDSLHHKTRLQHETESTALR